MMKLVSLAILLFAGFFGVAAADALHDVHKGAGVECATCHKPAPPAPVPDAVCVACHGTMLGPRQGEVPPSPDPHNSPHLAAGEIPVCTDCHKIHGASEVTCTVCHRGFTFGIK